MKYLLDVNALLARAHSIHTAYSRVAAWMKDLPAGDTLHTCSIVEIGFVRIAVQAKLQPDIAAARAALAAFKLPAPSPSSPMISVLTACRPTLPSRPMSPTGTCLLSLGATAPALQRLTRPSLERF